jgi:glucose dehydrogenase
MPLVADGVLYYTGSYSRVWAIDAATGNPLWSYFPKLNDDLVAAQTHSPYTRGIAIGQGKVFVGTVDGRLIAIDQKTGQPAWDTKLINSEKLTVGFTGAPCWSRTRSSSAPRAVSGRAAARSSGSTPPAVARSGSSSRWPVPTRP